MKIAADPSVDRWLKKSIVEQAQKQLGVHVQLGGLERNIILTRITLTDVTLRDLKGSGNSISVSRLVVAIDPYAFFRGKIVIKDLKLEGMFLDVVRLADGTVAVEPLFPFWRTKRPTGRKMLRIGFEIQNVALMDVDLSYRDVPAGIHLNLDEVVILLTKGRFDPPDRRTITLGARKGTLIWRVFPEGREVVINSLSSVLSITPEELIVTKLNIETGPLSLALSGTLPFRKNAALNGDLNISMNIGELPWLIRDSGGLIALKGNVGGDLSSPTFRGQLSGMDVRLAGRLMNRISADIQLDPFGCVLRDGMIEYGGEILVSEGELEFNRNLPFSMNIKTKGYPLSKLLKEVGGKTGLEKGFVSASLKVDGKLAGGESAIVMEGGVGVPLGGEAVRPMDFDLSGRYNKGTLQDLVLRASSGDTILQLEGMVSAGGPDLAISIVDEDLSDWNEVSGVKELGGSVTINGTVNGQWGDVVAQLDLELRNPSLNQFSGDVLQAHLDIGKAGLDLPMVTLRADSCVLVGRAHLPWNGDAEAQWADISMTDGQVEDLLAAVGLSFEISGKLGGNLYLSSRGSDWEGEGWVKLQSGKILNEPLEEIDLAGKIIGDVFKFEKLSVVKDGRRMEGTGTIRGDRYTLNLHTLDPILIDGVQNLKMIRVPLGGEISLTGEVTGTLDGSEVQASTELMWDQLSYDGRTWRSGKGTFHFEGPTLEGQAELLDGEISASAKVELGGAFPFSGTISTPGTISRAGINEFLGIGIPANLVSGQISVKADAEGILADINKTRIKGIINDADFTINGIHFTSLAAIPFDYFPETGIRFLNLPLSSGGSLINGSLRIAPNADIEGNVDGSIDLTGLTFLKPTADTFSGKAVIQIKVAGSLVEPVLNGSIELLGAECVAHLPFELPVSALEGNLEIVGNRLHISEIRGRADGGRLWMSGDLFMTGFKPEEGAISWRAEAVPIHFPKGLDTINRADLGLKFSDGRGFLRGTINMDQGTFNREVDIENLIALIGEGNGNGNELSRTEEGNGNGEWLNLDVEMVTAAPLVVDIKLVRGEASGNLHLRGTASNPVLTGRLEMAEGSIEYRGHVFEVSNGSVAFINPRKIEPSFDFSGRTNVVGFDREGVVTDYTVELIASGVPEKFKLDLVSSPALSEADIAALLTWGAVGERVFASRSGLSATEATLLLTNELKGKLETEVEKVTGFDRFTINPSSVSSSGERTTRIQVDKKLSEKFYLTYSTPILASEEQEVLVKYRITRSFSIVGEQQGERDYGLDLDFQFEIP